MPSTIITEIPYQPSISFFTMIQGHDILCIEGQEHYQRQTHRNRCQILTSQGVQDLIIPVAHGATQHQKMQDVQIDYTQKWLLQHLRALKAAYGKAPFFVYYFPALEEIYLSKKQSLQELNMALLTKWLQWLQWKPQCVFTSDYVPSIDIKDDYFDGRNRIQLIKDKFHHKIPVCKPYHQVFGTDFVSNLSILDLFFNVGPEAAVYLKESSSQFTVE